MLAFFNDLHIDLDVAIGKRENFDAMTSREAISAQDIDFLDVAIDEINDIFSERSRTISDANIERDMSFDDVNDEKIIDRDDVKDFDSKTDETIDCDEADFDFFACRVRICS